MASAPYPRTLTNGTFTGIQGNITIPMSWAAPGYDYIALYLGFNNGSNALIEGGISYKGVNSTWNYFLNPTGSSIPISPQPGPGGSVNVQLINNGNQTASLWINGTNVLTSKVGGMVSKTQVKMVMSYLDFSSAGEVWHSNATITGKVQSSLGGIWASFPGPSGYTNDAPNSPRYTVSGWSPLIAKLAT